MQKVTWFDYSKDKQFKEEITKEQLEWLRRQNHIEIDKVEGENMQNFKIVALQESIKLWEDIMIETQSQIRQSETVLEKMQKEYKRAMQEKSDLMDQLIEENDKVIRLLERK